MIIDRHGFAEIAEKLISTPTLSLDLETTGLRAFHQDKIISAVIADKDNSYYFNFQEYENLDPKLVLPEAWQSQLWSLFENKLTFMANAKFDLSFILPDIDKWGIHDVLLKERLIRNDRPGKYDLDTVARLYGMNKSDVVEEYIKEHKLWKWEIIPGKKSRVKNKFFWRVPFEIIAPYGLQDARITYDIGALQIQRLNEMNRKYGPSQGKSLLVPYYYEKRLINTLHKVEKKGIRIDRDYCSDAIKFLERELKENEDKFKAQAGITEFRDSAKFLAPILTAHGVPLLKTEKGNDKVDAEVLRASDNPICETLLGIRETHKRLNTYFRSYMYHADRDGIIHANFRQGGTASGRMSSSDPNLQNQIAEDIDDVDLHQFPIKRAFIPRAGRRFGELDYEQMEFKLMLIYAGQLDLIEKINNGFDAHTSTAELTGLPRSKAKTLNFSILYGMGLIKLAIKVVEMSREDKVLLQRFDLYSKLAYEKKVQGFADQCMWMLKENLMTKQELNVVSIQRGEAKKFRDMWFRGLPKVAELLKYISNQAVNNGNTLTWDGRLHWWTNSEFAYKAPNYVIQGGCAGIAKQAMNKIDEEMSAHKTDMLVQVHDSVLLEYDSDREYFLDRAKEIMESIFVSPHMKLTVSKEPKEHSWLS